MSVTSDPAGEIIAAGCRDTFEVVLWSLRTGRVLDVLAGHTGPVSSLAFHPTRGQLATGSWDATVRLWEVYSDTACEVLKHDKEVLALSYRPDGGELAVSIMNGTVALWDPEASREKGSIDAGRDCAPGRLRDQRTVAAKKGFFRTLCYSADSQFLLGGGDSNFICAYHVGEGREPALLQRYIVSDNSSLDGTNRKISTRELTDAGVGGKLSPSFFNRCKCFLSFLAPLPRPSLIIFFPSFFLFLAGLLCARFARRMDAVRFYLRWLLLAAHAVEDFDSDADDYEEEKRRAAESLPGVTSRREIRRAQTRCIRFSPTGRTWAAMTSEGLMVYSADLHWTSDFDPMALEVEVTEESVRQASKDGNHALAIRAGIRLGDPAILSNVVSGVPVKSISTIIQTIPSPQLSR